MLFRSIDPSYLYVTAVFDSEINYDQEQLIIGPVSYTHLGPVVYEFTHKKNKELYLRVDNDRYFMPVRFHFEKGDYSKPVSYTHLGESQRRKAMSLRRTAL